jgi:hypothetical protein
VGDVHDAVGVVSVGQVRSDGSIELNPACLDADEAALASNGAPIELIAVDEPYEGVISALETASQRSIMSKEWPTRSWLR